MSETVEHEKSWISLRYGGSSFDLRSLLLRALAWIQKKPVVILNSNPELCGAVLAASDRKGSFIEQFVATPAWSPLYSIESVDGDLWQQLSSDFKSLMAKLNWRERTAPLVINYASESKAYLEKNPAAVIDSAQISRLVLRVLYELLFDHRISQADEDLFYLASVEWRKEIAVRGPANLDAKRDFWKRISELVSQSKFKEGLVTYAADPACWLSIFAQPFLISPQINVGDIFVTVFGELKKDPALLEKATQWARQEDRARIDGIILESIRLKHPFPILERELKADLNSHGHHFARGTQFFILLDQFKQDGTFDPERWLTPAHLNAYGSIPFAAGPRMCVGKPIAMELMSALLKFFLSQMDSQKIQPEKGHRFSGRHNDGSQSFGESLYQLKIFAGVFFKSFRARGVHPKRAFGEP